ncbi:uncharacterized protein LOC129739404 [Uranotaenia lowii]|uniref:uncharacterized protein LOC129739404 n=1 Tax=Uranotaenia lowii TaxID=190385 RepID=UPI00247ACF2C|nr:uncharacterized protein LOC129739404 [Uranotaenia lowii]
MQSSAITFVFVLKIGFLLFITNLKELEARKCTALRSSCESWEKDATCFESPCSNFKYQYVRDSDKRTLLGIHNFIRKWVHTHDSELPKAVRMADLEWSGELQEIAEFLLGNCRAATCVATAIFPNATVVHYSASDINTRASASFYMIQRAGHNMRHLDRAQIISYDGKTNKEVKQILYHKARKVGCGLSWKDKKADEEKDFRLSCIYDQRPVKGEPVYELMENNINGK